MSRFASLLSTTLLLLICGCSEKAEITNLEEFFTVRVAEHVYNIPFEYNPSVDNHIASDLRDLQRGGVGALVNPLSAQHTLFRTKGAERAGVSSLAIQISARQNSPLTEPQLAKKIDVESIESVSVTGPIPGDDDPNSIYRSYELSADFQFADGRSKSVPFRCRGADEFGEIEGQTLFNCKLGLITDDKTGLLLRLGPYEDPDFIRKDISFALSCLLTLREGKQYCQ